MWVVSVQTHETWKILCAPVQKCASWKSSHGIAACLDFAGFEACLNARVDKPAELIARYLDSILRRGSKAAAQEGSLEDVLDAALALFRYVQVGRLCCCGHSLSIIDSACGQASCQKVRSLGVPACCCFLLSKNAATHYAVLCTCIAGQGRV